MPIEMLVVPLMAVLFAGIFLALFLSYREEPERTERAAPPDVVKAAGFYGWYGFDAAGAGDVDDLVRRQIEHYLRREALFVERFIEDPSPQTLRAGAQSRLGVC